MPRRTRAMLDRLAKAPIRAAIHDENLCQLQRAGLARADAMGGRWGGSKTTWTITTTGRDYLREDAA